MRVYVPTTSISNAIRLFNKTNNLMKYIPYKDGILCVDYLGCFTDAEYAMFKWYGEYYHG